MTNFTLKVYDRSKNSDEKAVRKWLDTCPPWRKQPKAKICDRQNSPLLEDESRGRTYVLDTEGMCEEKINFALLLRRPLLVTGPPGIGKTSLAYHLAWSLGLGEPLRWEINSRTTLADGLYSYDAVEHLRDSSLSQRLLHSSDADRSTLSAHEHQLGEFITLGALGTALLPTQRPRVLIVDELDKASFDLPNDLLHVFEEGAFKIPELVRSKSTQRVVPYDAKNSSDRVTISDGEVRTLHHPVVVITSNGEREFSGAFLRRCVQLDLSYPGAEQLLELVTQHLTIPKTEALKALCDEFAAAQKPTDAVLNAIFLHHACGLPPEEARRVLEK